MSGQLPARDPAEYRFWRLIQNTPLRWAHDVSPIVAQWQEGEKSQKRLARTERSLILDACKILMLILMFQGMLFCS